MSYKLEYPYNEQEKLDFIFEYNHQLGLKIEKVDNYIESFCDETISEQLLTNYPTYYALEANEIMVVNEKGLSVPVIDPDYETKLAQAESERIAKLYLTGADVERGIYKAIGMDFDDIIAFVIESPPVGLDVKALRIELKANNFYRGNPYVSAVGNLLGFTEFQLDRFFETNDYNSLISKENSKEVAS